LNSCQLCFVFAIMLGTSCPGNGPLNHGRAATFRE
jgi:hypothetical protein